MKWTNVDVASAKLLAFRRGLHSFEGHSFGNGRAARLQGSTPKQESLGGELIAGGGEALRQRSFKRVSFSVFASTTNRIQMASAEAKLTSGDRSRKRALRHLSRSAN